MSTLKVNDIQEATSGGSKIWPARAWFNFNGYSTGTIRDDGNVSSITDNGTGDYTVNFSSSVANSNYSFSGSSGGNSNATARSLTIRVNGNNNANADLMTTSALRIANGHAAYDTAYVTGQITL